MHIFLRTHTKADTHTVLNLINRGMYLFGMLTLWDREHSVLFCLSLMIYSNFDGLVIQRSKTIKTRRTKKTSY